MQHSKNGTLKSILKKVTSKKLHPLKKNFDKVSSMILDARKLAFRKVDAILVELYWKIGEYISRKVNAAEWGEGTVEKPADYLAKMIPDARVLTGVVFTG